MSKSELLPTSSLLGGAEETPEHLIRRFRAATPEQRAGVFVWPGLGGFQLSATEKELIQRYAPSGFVLFKRNFASLFQARQLVQDLKTHVSGCRRIEKLGLELMIDEEGGKVSRLPPPMVRGEDPFVLKDNLEKLLSQVLHQAWVTKGIGLTGILAPVCDILTFPDNPVMKTRCYGINAEEVVSKASAVFRILNETELKSCAKHFPGHGNTTTDSHLNFAYSDVDLETLYAREWLPFVRMIEEKIPYIMTAHVTLAKIDDKFPATLSSIFLTNILREKLKFQGVIVTDDLRMQAVSRFYNRQNTKVDADIFERNESTVAGNFDDSYIPLAALDSLKAGSDIILTCQSIEKEEPTLKRIALELENNAAFAKICEDKFIRIMKTVTGF